MQQHAQVEALGIRRVNGVDFADLIRLENTVMTFDSNALFPALECLAWFTPSVI